MYMYTWYMKGIHTICGYCLLPVIPAAADLDWPWSPTGCTVDMLGTLGLPPWL